MATFLFFKFILFFPGKFFIKKMNHHFLELHLTTNICEPFQADCVIYFSNLTNRVVGWLLGADRLEILVKAVKYIATQTPSSFY